MTQRRYMLDEKDIPTHWYNIVADMPHRRTADCIRARGEPIGPDDLAPLFPMALIMQEVSAGALRSRSPRRCATSTRLWRPTPLYRARRLEQALGTDSPDLLQVRGRQPGRQPQAEHRRRPGLLQQAGGPRRGSRPRPAPASGAARSRSPAQLFGLECKVYMVRVSYEQKPYRRSMMQTWGARSSPSPSTDTQRRPRDPRRDPDSPGSLGIAISEAVEDAATRDDTKYSLGSVLNHVLLHQTVIGQEAHRSRWSWPAPTRTSSSAASAAARTSPGSPSRSSREKIAGREIDVLACEPAACPTLTRGLFALRLRRHGAADAARRRCTRSGTTSCPRRSTPAACATTAWRRSSRSSCTTG